MNVTSLPSIRFALIVCAGMAAGATRAADIEAEPGIALRLSNALANGHMMIEFRPRYNLITETAKSEKTDVFTYRAMLGWQTAPFFDVRMTAQFLHADIVGARRLNDDPTQFFASPYPLLPDPRTTGISQLFFDYAGLEATRIRLGRQVLRMDNQRFISDVDFRQTPQVFDGITVTNSDLPNTRITAGEYRRMRSVLGADSRLRLSILNLAWNPLPDHAMGAYGYWHDTPATGAQTGFSNNAQRIAGIRSEGTVASASGSKFLYYAEYANQKRIGEGDARIDAHYYRLGGGVAFGDFGARLDHEVKGSNGGKYGFQTPLSDYYAFNGFALQYTSTPPQGLRDTWLTLHTDIGKLDCFVEVHRYKSDFGGLALGREWDAKFSYPILSNLQAQLQLARFSAGADARSKNDVDKTWLALVYNY